jgi:hypothetical protein
MEGKMKKLFAATIILLISVLMAGCSTSVSTTSTSPNAETTSPPTQTITTTAAPAPTPGPNSLVISRDVFTKDGHQNGEIHLAPGETFSVSLARDETQKRVWEESPEITNQGVINKVDYKTMPIVQTWTYRAADNGVCMILFKTGGQVVELREWTYSLTVVVASGALSTFTGNNTMEQTFLESADGVTDYDNMLYYDTEHQIYDLQGAIEGKSEGSYKYYTDLHTGDFWIRGKATVTGTVSGKSGTFDIYWVGKGVGTMWTGRGTCIGAIISGTGELANLRGTSYMEFSWAPADLTKFPPHPKTTGTMSSTLWFME